MKILFVQILFTLIVLISCDSPSDLNPAGDNFGGRITFADTNILRTATGYYAISIFGDSTNPFNRIPVRSDSLKPFFDFDKYKADYQMSGISKGKYFVAVTWKHFPKIENEVPDVLGILGCDTTRSCTNYKYLLFPYFAGEYQYILCHTDTLKKLN